MGTRPTREDTALDELLRAEVLASMADKRPSVPAEDVFRRIEARHARKLFGGVPRAAKA